MAALGGANDYGQGSYAAGEHRAPRGQDSPGSAPNAPDLKVQAADDAPPYTLADAIGTFPGEEGLSLSMLHIGPFDNEQQTFDEMESFCKLNNLKRVSEIHREIYLNNLHRTDPSKLKTILRYQVEKN